ncbi:MAG: SPOR domain-containing protein [Balneolales bacterium]
MRTLFYYAIISLFIIGLAQSISHAQESPSHWSIDVFGGTGLTNFEVESDPKPAYGLNLRYSITPITSVYGTYYRGQFTSSDNNDLGRIFETDFNHYSLRAQINLLRLLDADAGFLSNSALDGIFGIGIMTFDNMVDIDEQGPGYPDYQGSSSLGNTQTFIAGGSIRQYLSRRIDFIAQFEYNFTGTNLIDGYETVAGNGQTQNRVRDDAYTMITAGFSIKFGSNRREHYSWQDEPPVSDWERRRQVDELLALFEGRLAEVNEEITQAEDDMKRLNNLMTQTYARQLEAHNQKLSELESEMENLKGINEDNRLGKLDYSLPNLPQYFVIAESFNDESLANNRLNELIRNGFQEARIIVDYDKDHFNVSYSQYDSFRAANDRLRQIKRNENPEAWIYTVR